jgi:hypothetical protein
MGTRGTVSKYVTNRHKTRNMWYWNLEKKHLFLYISSTNTDTLVRRNLHHGSALTVVSANSASPFHHLRLSHVLERISRPSHRVILSIKNHKRMLLFGSRLHKQGRNFDYWHQPLKMRMRICYLDCHEAELCCYLVIHTGNLLYPLQLLCFHLRLNLVHTYLSYGFHQSNKSSLFVRGNPIFSSQRTLNMQYTYRKIAESNPNEVIEISTDLIFPAAVWP